MNAPSARLSARSCWGIYRELAHSLGREVDDAEILRATARRLESLGQPVTLLTPDEAAASTQAPSTAFVMCERPPILELLGRWEENGTRIVNRVSAILNTRRHRMVALFEKDKILFPRSILVATGEPLPDDALPSRATPVWIKRGDHHKTREDDVSFAAGSEPAAIVLAQMAERGIERAVIQEHVPGDLIKFYGVAAPEENGEPWFQWFYHRDQNLSHHPFDTDALAATAARAAGSLGLEVYGGDAIAAADGRLVVIDVNAWPSFALYRQIASDRIAARVAACLRREAGPVEARP
jgi:hypothetical protein